MKEWERKNGKEIREKEREGDNWRNKKKEKKQEGKYKKEIYKKHYRLTEW